MDPSKKQTQTKLIINSSELVNGIRTTIKITVTLKQQVISTGK